MQHHHSDSTFYAENAELHEARLMESNRIARVLLRSAFAVFAVLAWAACLEGTYHEYRQTRAAVAQRDANLASAVQNYSAQLTRSARAVHLMVRGLLAEGSHSDTEIMEVLADRLRANGDAFAELGVCLPDGRVLPSATPGGALTPQACKALIAATAPGPNLSAPAALESGNRLLLPLTLSFQGDEGEFLGVGVALVPAERMLGLMDATQLADRTVVGLVGTDGSLRTAWRSQAGHERGRARLEPLAAQVRPGATFTAIDGDDYLVSWRDVPNQPLGVFVATARDDAFAAYSSRRLRIVVLCSLLTATLGLGYLLMHRMGRDSLVRARALSRARSQLVALNDDLDNQVKVRTQLLERACKDLEQFSYTVAHDVRTPLASIAGFAAALEPAVAQSRDPRHAQYLQRIQTCAAHMDSLTRQLLKVAQGSRSALSFHDVDLTALAEEVVVGLRHADPARRVEVSIAPNLRAHGDRTLLRQVLENLLGNAWKFSAQQASAAIAFEGKPGEAMGSFVVRDNGVGFDSDASEGLFQPFKRLHSAEAFQGTGVGLATVQRIVTLHGGSVWCQSRRGQGAEFFFTLPAPGMA